MLVCFLTNCPVGIWGSGGSFIWVTRARTARGAEMAWRGQLSKNLKELRILFCQTSPSSAPARYSFSAFSFALRSLLKTTNPAPGAYCHKLLINGVSALTGRLWKRITRTSRLWIPNFLYWSANALESSRNYGLDMVLHPQSFHFVLFSSLYISRFIRALLVFARLCSTFFSCC